LGIAFSHPCFSATFWLKLVQGMASQRSKVPGKAMSEKAISRLKKMDLQRKVASWNLREDWTPIVVECLLAAQGKDLYGLEIFAGEKAVANGLGRVGLVCATLELLDGQDVAKPSGQRFAIRCLCRCHPCSLVWLGTPCSSWVFLGRSNAGRYTWFPAGDQNKEYTRTHNLLADISIDLSWLAFCLGLHVVIEQPLSSILFQYEPMKALLSKTQMQRTVVQLGNFGAASMKTLQLFGTVPWLAELRQENMRRQHAHRHCDNPTGARKRASQESHLEQKLTYETTDRLGRVRVTGKKLALKESSAYPPEFGRVVGELHRKTIPISSDACQGHACKGKKRLFSIKDHLSCCAQLKNKMWNAYMEIHIYVHIHALGPGRTQACKGKIACVICMRVHCLMYMSSAQAIYAQAPALAQHASPEKAGACQGQAFPYRHGRHHGSLGCADSTAASLSSRRHLAWIRKMGRGR